MTSYRLFPAANGPPLAAASGGWLLGTLFSVTGGMRWFEGYWQWVPTGGDLTPREFALWNRWGTGATDQTVVPGSTVTSGPLSATPTGESGGHWNFVPVAAPVQIAPGALYVAASGYTATNGIPVGSAQWGSGDPLAAGVVNGPLTAWSATSGTNPFPAATVNYGLGQNVFSNVLGADPAAAMPDNGSGDDFLGMDVQVGDTAPAGFSGSFRMYPSMADLGNFSLDTANGFTLGKEFTLSAPCTAGNGWFYSPPGVSVLPTKVGFYRTSDQSLVLVNTSPSWSGAAGSGWVSAPVPGTLPADTYKYVVFQGSNVIWNAAVANYYTTGFGGGGLVAGPISVPDNAGSLSPGQESYHQGASIAYPDTNAGPFAYGLDFELTEISGTPHTAAMQTGSWWGLDAVLKQSKQEFEAFVSRPPMACPNDGEPLRNPPNTAAGAGVGLYCKFCGFQYPRDWVAPVRL